MRVSPAGRAAIRQREGCRLAAYRDTRGIWTIGVGHVNMTPPVVTPGMRITEAQADAFLADDLAPVEATIARCVRVPLTQSQVDALASLGFNIGIGGLARSTVVSRLNRCDVAGAADAFLLWAHPAELLGRRRAERVQFLAPDEHLVTLGADEPASPDVKKALQPAAPAPAAPSSVLARLAFFFGRH